MRLYNIFFFLLPAFCHLSSWACFTHYQEKRNYWMLNLFSHLQNDPSKATVTSKLLNSVFSFLPTSYMNPTFNTLDLLFLNTFLVLWISVPADSHFYSSLTFSLSFTDAIHWNSLGCVPYFPADVLFSSYHIVCPCVRFTCLMYIL